MVISYPMCDGTRGQPLSPNVWQVTALQPVLTKQLGGSTRWRTVCRYMPPEMLTAGRLTTACDVYSFGILMWELVTCQFAFAHLPVAQIVYRVVHLVGGWARRLSLVYSVTSIQCVEALEVQGQEHSPAVAAR